MELKLLNARDIVLAYLMKEELTIEETKQVLQMCNDEVDAAVKRSKLKLNTAEKTANAKFSAEKEERSLRGEAELNQSDLRSDEVMSNGKA